MEGKAAIRFENKYGRGLDVDVSRPDAEPEVIDWADVRALCECGRHGMHGCTCEIRCADLRVRSISLFGDVTWNLVEYGKPGGPPAQYTPNTSKGGRK